MHDFHGHFGGMHFIWWIVWLILLIWLFLIPRDIPFRSTKKEDPLHILKKRFANGEISKEEYEESKNVLTKDTNLLK
jgi:putative membrane protein